MNTELRPFIEQSIERFERPFYFYDLDGLNGHIEDMSSHLVDGIKLWYACKANPMSAILKILRNQNFGVDIASIGELQQVLNSGIKPNDIIATGPGKSKEYLETLVKAGVENIVLESLNQVKWLNEVCYELNCKVNALLRFQIEWSEGKSVLGGNSITPFGLDEEQWLRLDSTQYDNINFIGYHIFQWGNILKVDHLAMIWERCISEAKSLASKMKIDLKVIDLGGGLGIPYSKEESPLEFSEVMGVLKDLKQKHKLEMIWMELGRFAVGEYGSYFTKVLDKKEVRGKKILVLEGGINHIARVALTDQSFPATMVRNSNSPSEEFQVHGPLCTALDKHGDYKLPRDIETGDWLAFTQCGAYGFTESMPYFLCHELPGEIIYYKGDIMIPRPPKTSYEWMI